MPTTIGNITVHLGPIEQGGPDSLLAPRGSLEKFSKDHHGEINQFGDGKKQVTGMEVDKAV